MASSAWRKGGYLIWIMGLTAIVGCGPCQNLVAFEAWSPARHWRAVVTGRNCGATTWYTTEVSILRPSESIPSRGNVSMVSDGNRALDLPVTREGALHVGLRWSAEDRLVITYPYGAFVGKQKPTFRGISIEYESGGE
jgi:hypothetical protein